MKQLSKKHCYKSSNTKRQGIKIKRWFKQEKRNAQRFKVKLPLNWDWNTIRAKPKLSETLKSITGNDLGKVQVAEQDKSNKEKIETAIKEAIVTKVPTLKDKELKLNADLSKKSVTFCKDFEGEVTLKFEIETQQRKIQGWKNPGGENQTESDEEPEEEAEKAYREAAMEWDRKQGMST
ncbi:hypothetical protein HYE20_03750 [Mycoplasmopsis bovis]|nr:hypothetical protein [Mycoplasmopsis bovis]QQH24677.1 hypothetical protein HYE20_03750 [Mycoplasmopsis bovis]